MTGLALPDNSLQTICVLWFRDSLVLTLARTMLPRDMTWDSRQEDKHESILYSFWPKSLTN